MVRLVGVEPTTTWFVARYSIQLSYKRTSKNFSITTVLLIHKEIINGALGRSRTYDHLVRSQVLYPAELQAHTVC